MRSPRSVRAEVAESAKSAEGTVIAYDRAGQGPAPEVLTPVLTEFFLGSAP
jgi:hypothetical protein